MNETILNEDAILDEFERRLKRAAATSFGGQMANSRGKLMDLLLKRTCGAESPNGRGDNLATIDGAPTRFHTADGISFTFNEQVEPTVLVLMSYKGKPTADKPLLGKIYGLRLADCLRVGKKVKGNGTERISVSLARVNRVALGIAQFPARWTEAESVQHRLDLEDEIEKLTADELATMISARTRENIRAFVLAGREVAAPATSVITSSAVQEVARAAASGQPPIAQLGDAAPLAAGDPPPSVPVEGALEPAERASAASNGDLPFNGANSEDTA